MKLLTVKEAAEAYGISDKLIYAAIQDRELKAIRLGNTKYRLTEDAINAWLERRSTTV